jgi:hypothetical protein
MSRGISPGIFRKEEQMKKPIRLFVLTARRRQSDAKVPDPEAADMAEADYRKNPDLETQEAISVMRRFA